MSAVVCGKRASSYFEEFTHATGSPPAAKRARCVGSASPSLPTWPRDAADSALVADLSARFPAMSLELIEKALEESGNDLDSAIKSLLNLHLESVESKGDPACEPPNQITTEVQVSVEADALSFSPSPGQQPSLSSSRLTSPPLPWSGGDSRGGEVRCGRRARGSSARAGAAFGSERGRHAGRQRRQLLEGGKRRCRQQQGRRGAVEGAARGQAAVTRTSGNSTGRRRRTGCRGRGQQRRVTAKQQRRRWQQAQGGGSGSHEQGRQQDGDRVSAPPESVPCSENLPSDGSEWVEFLVNEMASASNKDDAKACASRALEFFEKVVISRVNAQAPHGYQKENTVIKEQLDSLIRENTILKRAFAIQHERQKDYDEKNQELQQLKQLVAQYQEQVRNLEVNNYALSMHLRQAQQGSSIPGRFLPDVF